MFAPPGPGEWSLDRSHYPGGTTPISQWLIGESMAAGLGRAFAELGVPADHIEARFVNGFMYTRLRPLIMGDRPAKKAPPTPILRLVARVHPAFRARAKQAEKTFRDRPSNEVASRWEREIRPRLRATNLDLQRVAPDGLPDDALQAHVDALLDRLRENYELHFWLHGHDIGPLAKYLHACIGWGVDPVEAIKALSGASPSTAAPMTTLCELKTLVDGSARLPESLDDVRAISDEAAALLDRYLDERGNILATGYDITSFRLIELPDLVVDSIRSAVPPAVVDHAALAAELREQVPAAERSDFDEFLGDARAVMDMRDDNGPLTVEWPTGLLRRALLAAGARLTDRGQLARADHALELTPDEARSLFGPARPGAGDLERRAERRARLAALTPPDTLGDPEPAPLLDALPPALARIVGMVQVSLKYMGMDGQSRYDRLDGVGVGRDGYTGRARVAASADDAIDKLEPGDVLIVRVTSPAFNAVLAIAGAVVTANGGLLSHAAVIARELGIPAVIGATGALTIPDGSTVHVDPSAGTVRVVDPAAESV